MNESRLIRKAARATGVATSYIDYKGDRVEAGDAVLLKLINALDDGAPLSEPPKAEELKNLVAAARARLLTRGLPPVIVAWNGVFPATWMWLQAGVQDVKVTLRPEQGAAIVWNQTVTDVACIARRDGKRFRLVQHEAVPHGYYTIEVETGGRIVASSFLISSRYKIAGSAKSWGAFVPPYAVRSERGNAIGTFRELGEAATFVRRKGGRFLGTLPLLATYYDGPHKNASPYSPVSRLFWNEIYLDIDNLPGFSSPSPQRGEGRGERVSASQPPHSLTPTLSTEGRGGDDRFIDYDSVYAAKKQILQKAADLYFAVHPDGDDDFKAYEAKNPCLRDYARFRAAQASAVERQREERYHLYVQYACHRQLAALRAAAEAGEAAELYIDYPIGQHSDGFDADHFSHLFLDGFEVGAPPDFFFRQGQRWGFRPFHPRAFEHDRFAYFRATIAHYFSTARMLRLDHIMGLYRIFCTPDGASGAEGAYVYYPFRAFLAVLCLEAERYDGILIGEDLGTVPEPVDSGMKRHGLNRMWILQFNIKAEPEQSFGNVEPAMIAGFNTHDMFPFESFLAGEDLDRMLSLELLKPEEAEKMKKERVPLLKGWRTLDKPYLIGLEGLAKSPANYVMIALEELWGEKEPQNIPGTVDQYPNWRRTFALPLEQWNGQPDMNEAFSILNESRQTS